jgi:hypothetical protein
MSQIIHNPGSVPDSQLNVNTTDITVVFEQSYGIFKQQQDSLQALAGDRSSRAYIIHSVPLATNLERLVDDLVQHAQNIFLTDLTSNYYQGFGKDWSDFVKSIS